MRFLILVGFLFVSVSAFPKSYLPHPSELIEYLNEEQFEDYLEEWLEVEEDRWNRTRIQKDNQRSGECVFNVRSDFLEPQPVYIRNGNFLRPTGTSGDVRLAAGEQITISCVGSGRTIQHPNIQGSHQTVTATCVGDKLISGSQWLTGNGNLGDLSCSTHSYYTAEKTSEKCYNNHAVLRVGFYVGDQFYTLYRSCFDESRLEVLYVEHELSEENAFHQTGVDRPSWLQGSFYSGLSVNNLYTQVTQKATITSLIGSKADEYITSSEFLTRGHLVAKSDYVFATGQRATHFFNNAAPQWNRFNGGNWNSLEQDVRQNIANKGYLNLEVYTGTFGVTQLRNANNDLVDLFLYYDNNNNPAIPVPLYYYKVVYDPSRQTATAFISVNNPYYTDAEFRSLVFCTDRCSNNNNFQWLTWKPERVDLGYSFCCDINEFRAKIPHLPSFAVTDLWF